jgi:tetratricopeptide (TPR) repeat protein
MGYSRLMGEDEVGTIQTPSAYKEVMTGPIEHRRSRVVDAPGDNLLAEVSLGGWLKGGIMSKQSFAYLATGILFFTCLVSLVGAQGKNDSAGEAYHIQKGMEYYNKGFYQSAAKRQQEEAKQNYELAISEFKMAISVNPDSEVAHRNLARVFYVQKNFEEAAREYKKVTELNPYDIDAHVVLALTLTKMKRFEEAIAQLQDAKTWTTDDKILEKLDGYIQKLEANR